MHFPLAYTGEIVFYKPDNFVPNNFLNQLTQTLDANKSALNSQSYSAALSYSKLPIKIVFAINTDGASVSFSYQISLFENNLVLIFSWVLAFFFIHFHSVLFGSIALIVGLLFYIINLLKISNTIKNTIWKLIGEKTNIGEPELWKKQQQWMKDKTLCQACGEPKNKYSNKCINCGLYFSKNVINTDNTNTSTQSTKQIIYKVLKKKK